MRHLDEGAVVGAVAAHDAQRVSRGVGDVLAVGGQARVDDGAGYVEGAHLRRRVDEVDGVQAAGEREHGVPDGVVDGVPDDARAALAHPLAARPLLVRELLGALVQRGGVGEEALLAGRGVELPEPADDVGAAERAHEHDARAVGGDGVEPGRAGGEAVGPRVLPGEGLGGRGGLRGGGHAGESVSP